MKRLLIVLSLALALNGAVVAQTNAASTAVLEKLRQIDLLNHLLPLVMTKEQIRKLLPVIEKCRRDVKIQQDEEAKMLAQKAAAVDKAVKDGVEKGDVPDKQFIRDLNAMIVFFTMKRRAIASDNTDMVYEVMKTTLNAGQLKAAGNSLNLKVFGDIGMKPEEMKDEDRIKFFISEVVLDPLAYDILVRMQAGQRG